MFISRRVVDEKKESDDTDADAIIFNDPQGVTLSKFALGVSVILYLCAMSSLLFLYELIKPTFT
ncbi:Uncharacterized protein BM_BM14359 [Brugia malayi]|uniref:Bm14359 n=2 Tax=Onchocercidae TaxID=6296 RepID=A0A0J9Y4E9_BRUMA|nr:Uncharacterized protein BM_BM14359 [Brugia malayi]CDQ02051.1 Bm14359 [Brugia malayi]VIO96155.1 Uncharacterized protein BM_BM14359 [Brugia malayi]